MAYLRKVKPRPIERYEVIMERLSSMNDFEMVGEEEPVNNVVALFRERGHEFSVFTVDWAREAVVLVRVKEGAGLYSKISLFQAHLELTEEILSIPISELQSVADSVMGEIEHMQEIFLYMTGRCGMTVLLDAVNVTPTVQAVKLPNVYSVVARAAEAAEGEQPPEGLEEIPKVLADDETTTAFLKNITALLNYHLLKSDPNHRSTVIYSLTPDTINMGDLMAKAHPKSKAMFLYRSGLQFFESHMRLIFSNEPRYYNNFRRAYDLGKSRYNWPDELPYYMKVFGDDPELNTDEKDAELVYYTVTMWQGVVQSALDLHTENPQNFFHAVINYKALAERKEKAFKELMDKLDIKVNLEDADLKEALIEVFGTESQANTPFSSHPQSEDEEYKPHPDSWVGDWEQGVFEDICTRTGWKPVDPDFVFPNCIC